MSEFENARDAEVNSFINQLAGSKAFSEVELKVYRMLLTKACNWGFTHAHAKDRAEIESLRAEVKERDELRAEVERLRAAHEYPPFKTLTAEQPLVGSDSYQGDSTNAEKLLTEKPREWWIHPSVDGNGLVEVLCSDPKDDCIKPYIHVIEKSAYEAIKREYEAYIDGRPSSWYIVQLKQERDSLQKEVTSLTKEVERMTKAYDCMVKENARLRAALEGENKP